MLAGRAPWSCPATLVHLHSHFGIYTEEREGENIPSPSSSSPKGQTSLLGQERREDHPLCVGPSHTAAPSPQGWCQLCAMPMLWTMHSTGTNCQNLVPLLPLMKKHSQKCKFTKQCFHWSYLLFHNLFMFLVSLVISLCYSVHICWTLICCVNTIHAPAHNCCVTESPPSPTSSRLLRRASSHLRLESGWSLESLSFPGVIPGLRWVLHTHVPRHRPEPYFSVITPYLGPLMNCVAKPDAWHFPPTPFSASPDPRLTPVSDRDREVCDNSAR